MRLYDCISLTAIDPAQAPRVLAEIVATKESKDPTRSEPRSEFGEFYAASAKAAEKKIRRLRN
jgi:hypothetical protein